jgi:hypothetical protein
MLKIVEVHLSAHAGGEYLVIQNHGLTTLSLRGWAVCSDRYLHDCPESAAREMYVFQDDISIKPYTRIVLFTGQGETGWRATTDGKTAYVVYWARTECAWHYSECVNLLHIACSKRIVTPEQAEEVVTA